MDDLRMDPLERIVPHSSQNVRGPPGDLAPRKGQFRGSPWQRDGTTIPKKSPPCKATRTCPLHFKEGVMMGRTFTAWGLSRTIPMALPWAASGVPGAECGQLAYSEVFRPVGVAQIRRACEHPSETAFI